MLNYQFSLKLRFIDLSSIRTSCFLIKSHLYKLTYKRWKCLYAICIIIERRRGGGGGGGGGEGKKRGLTATLVVTRDLPSTTFNEADSPVDSNKDGQLGSNDRAYTIDMGDPYPLATSR